MRSFFIGIDPGLSGAFAVLDQRGDLVEVEDLPTLRTQSGRSLIDAERLARYLERFRGDAHVFIEQVSARPTDSRVGAFAFGRSVGATEAVVTLVGLAMQRVNPQVWKRSCDLPVGAEKSASIEAARRLIPGSEKLLTSRGHHGRADALLIARYGVLRYCRDPDALGKRYSPALPPAGNSTPRLG